MAVNSQSILTHKIVTVVALVLAIYGNIRYALGRAPIEKTPEDDPFFRVGFTPFTGNILVILIYWGFLHFLQILFVSQYFFPESTTTNDERANTTVGNILGSLESSSRLKTAQGVGVYFTVFNILQFVWTLLFVHGHYIWSELIIILNFFNIIALYNTQKTYNLKNFSSYILIHFPTAALPFSWLLYALFWNGAVVVGSNSLAARIVANVFIWDFLLVAGFNLIIYRDWAIGLSTSALTLALALGQFFTKIFALQWIFAFIISGLLLLGSVAVFSADVKRGSAGARDAENAPLINN